MFITSLFCLFVCFFFFFVLDVGKFISPLIRSVTFTILQKPNNLLYLFNLYLFLFCFCLFVFCVLDVGKLIFSPYVVLPLPLCRRHITCCTCSTCKWCRTMSINYYWNGSETCNFICCRKFLKIGQSDLHYAVMLYTSVWRVSRIWV